MPYRFIPMCILLLTSCRMRKGRRFFFRWQHGQSLLSGTSIFPIPQSRVKESYWQGATQHFCRQDSSVFRGQKPVIYRMGFCQRQLLAIPLSSALLMIHHCSSYNSCTKHILGKNTLFSPAFHRFFYPGFLKFLQRLPYTAMLPCLLPQGLPHCSAIIPRRASYRSMGSIRASSVVQ